MFKQFECDNLRVFWTTYHGFSASRYDFNKSLIHHDAMSHLSDAKRMDNVYLQNYLCPISKKRLTRVFTLWIGRRSH